MALAIHTPVPTLIFVAEPPVNSVAFSIQILVNSITLSVQPFSPAVLGHDWGNHCYYQ